MVSHNHYVATSYVYDRNTDRFLLVWHKKSRKLLPPGGHLNSEEEPHKGAQRELLEETGVEGRILNLLETPQVETPATAQLPTPFCILYEKIPAEVEGEEHMHIDFVYVVEIPPFEPLSLRAEEVSLAQWVPSEDIDHVDTYENVKQVCRAISSISKRAGIASA
jgi:8-oxo-dGTP pyrophosphatase MutT (NUDIX family)